MVHVDQPSAKSQHEYLCTLGEEKEISVAVSSVLTRRKIRV